MDIVDHLRSVRPATRSARPATRPVPTGSRPPVRRATDLQLIASIANAARDLHGLPVEDTAQAIVDIGRTLVPGTTWATLVTGRRKQSSVRTLAATSGTPDLSRVQQQAKQGPALHAMWEDSLVWSDDLRRDDRWPALRSAATAAGVRSLIAVRLSVSTTGHCLGALTFWSDRPAAGDLSAMIIAQAFGAHASIALDKATLNKALLNRDLIGQAKGILMERHRLDGQAAFDRLVKASQNSNRSLDDVAHRLVFTGEIQDQNAR